MTKVVDESGVITARQAEVSYANSDAKINDVFEGSEVIAKKARSDWELHCAACEEDGEDPFDMFLYDD